MSIVPAFTAMMMLVLSVWCFARILGKAGRSPWWSLLMVLPVVNLVLIWVFAFIRWPTIEDYGEPMPTPTPRKARERTSPSEDKHRSVNPHLTRRKGKAKAKPGRSSVPEAGSDG